MQPGQKNNVPPLPAWSRSASVALAESHSSRCRMSPEELSQKAVKPGELAMNCRSLTRELGPSTAGSMANDCPARLGAGVSAPQSKNERERPFPHPRSSARDCDEAVTTSQRPLANEVNDQRCHYASQCRQGREDDRACQIWRPKRLAYRR